VPTPPDPIAFTIPGINHPVYWYGLMVTLGTLAAAFVADREARRRGHNPDRVWDALILVMIFGLIGARLYHVVSSPAGSSTNLQYYLEDPIRIINFWGGGLRGLGIYGAIAGGVLGLWIYTKWKKLKFAEWADICILGAPLGQAIGRWGNYFNQELYGTPTDVPWALPVPDVAQRLPEYQALPASQGFHPTFLYESLWNLLVFFVLIFVARNWDDRLRHGDVVLLYLILYPLGRFLIEYQRPDAWDLMGVPAAQLLSVALMIGAALLIVVRHRRPQLQALEV
jgi:phosphatidylglycerol---prolipoprotein diacylglyceryl transferase